MNIYFNVLKYWTLININFLSGTNGKSMIFGCHNISQHLSLSGNTICKFNCLHLFMFSGLRVNMYS